MASLDDDFYNSLNQKYQRNATIRWLLTVVNVFICCGWVIGASGLSIAWLVLLIAVVALIWSSNLIRLVETATKEETMKVRRRSALFKDETAEWLNILFNRWWVFSSRSIFQLLRERFEPLLNDVKPSFVEYVELRQFTFGEQTPCVKYVKTYDVVDGKRAPYNGHYPNISRTTIKYQVAVEVDLFLNSDEFRLLLRARLFGKGVGLDLDLAVEKLNICGKLELLLTIDMDSAFPHITDITLMFIEKPEVWFSIKMLKAVQIMEVPILKTWIHSVFMDALEAALVDPGKLHINLSEKQITPGINKGVSSAQGVLTVIVSASQFNCINSDLKWIVLKMGKQHYKSSSVSQNWSETPSFLVESLQTDKLVIKLKSKRLISTVTLAQYEMDLNEYNLENAHNVETLLQKKSAKGTNIPNITIRLEYTPLPDVSSDQSQFRHLGNSVGSGVVTVFIHSAQELIFSDDSHNNSYCMLFSNRHKVLTTHCVCNSTSPRWESRCQILVNDYTQTCFSFVVCSSWNPKKMSNDEMLGVAVFNCTEGETWVQNRQLPLSESAYSKATITVSIIFQGVDVMNDTVTAPLFPSSGSDIDSKSDTSDGKSKNSYSSLMQQTKYLPERGDQELQSALSISQILSSGAGLMEISLMQARDLIPMDKSGLRDPYCELKVNGECKYKSSVKKKTLNPVWEENAIMGLPKLGETFDVVLWDSGIFEKNDFLGSIAFTLDDIRQLSSLDSPKWYALLGVRSGTIELKIQIISEDMATDKSLSKKPRCTNSVETSPIVRRPSLERPHIRLGVHVPPPTPPRTVSIPQHKNGVPTLAKEADENLRNRDSRFIFDHSDLSTFGSFQSLSSTVPRLTVTENSPSLTRNSSRASSQAPTYISVGEQSPSEPSPKSRSNVEFSAFRSMREKVSKSLRLRRFKSEVSVRQEGRNDKNTKGRNEVDFPRQESLTHAFSQPNIRNGKSAAIRPTELNVCPAARPEKYTGVEGKVLQAQGLHVAHVAQLYCRIKLIGAQGNEKNGKPGNENVGKTLAKSHLLPAVPNPQFDLPFQICNPESVPRQAILLFEIKSSGKEVVAVRRVTLQDLLSAEGKETHTWLALSNGATLEVTIAHGRELKKQPKKLFRSWSVHRIGKI